MKLPTRSPLAYEMLSKEEFDYEIQKGMDSIANGQTISAQELRAELKRSLGI